MATNGNGIKIPFNFASHFYKRSGTAALTNKSKGAGVAIDTADGSRLKFNKAGTVVNLLDTTEYQLKRCTTQLDKATNTTLADITGLTGFSFAAAGVYAFEVNLATTAGASGGVKVAFNYTTMTLTSVEATGIGHVAAAVAVQHSTTTTTQTSFFAQTAAVLHVHLVGSF